MSTKPLPQQSAVQRRLSALRHKAFVHGFSGIAPFYVVNEFPKCGGTWLGQMLAMALDLPFRRNEPIRFEKAITHGHFLRSFGLRNVIVLWRDPRDVLVSFYFHSFFKNEFRNGPLVDAMRQRAPFDDFENVSGNLPAFIKMLSVNPVSPRFTWPEFVSVWADKSETIQTRYEDLREDTAPELTRIVRELAGMSISTPTANRIVEELSFERAKAKSAAVSGDGVPFVREGSVGGWSKHFTPQANEALERYGYRDGILKLGYPDIG